MANTFDTLYLEGDLLIAKIKECNEAMPILIEHTKQVNNGTKSFLDCLSTTSFAICFAITIIALLFALTFLIFHCQNIRSQAKKDKNEFNRERERKKYSKDKEIEDRPYSDKKERLGKLRALKAEYQKRTLDYLEKKNGPIPNDDAFLATIKDFLDAIDSDIKKEEKTIDNPES